MVSDYRFAPALRARLLGLTLLVAAVLVLLVTLLVALKPLPQVALLVLALLVLAALAGLMIWTGGYAVRFTDDGYRVRGIRGAGTMAARWVEVEDAVTTVRHGSPCIVLRLRDGRSTTIPVEALAVDRDSFAQTVRDRLDGGHGIRRLG